MATATACCCVWALLTAAPLLAQPNDLGGDPRPRTTEVSGPPRSIQETRTPLYYLPDKEGRLVPVPGFTLEDFDRMLMRETQVGNREEPPPVVIDHLDVAATVEEERARVTVKLKLTVATNQWVRAGLRMSELALQESKISGADESLWQLSDDGYVCWVRCPEASCELTLTGLLRVEQIAREQRLRLTAPRATVSLLALQVPIQRVEARAVGGATLLRTEQSQSHSTLMATGLGGRFELIWRPADREAMRTPAVLEAAGKFMARVDGSGVRHEADLTIRSFQGPFSGFRVRLPEGSRLADKPYLQTPDNETEHDVRELPGMPRTVDVQLTRPTTGPVKLQLITERLSLDEPADTPVQLSGFEVMGAGRQSGHLAVQVNSDWHLQWGVRRGVWQLEVDKLPEPLDSEPVQAAFEYFSQPFSLSARLVRRQPRVSVEPSYEYVVFDDRIELRAVLQYAIRRAGVDTLEVNLPPGWEQVSVARLHCSRPDTIDLDAVVEDETHPLMIPLKGRQTGEFELTLEAACPLEPDSETIRISIPAPVVNNLGPATVRVQPADDIELTPNSSGMIGMSPHPVGLGRSRGASAEWQQKPLDYRTSVATARFVAGRTIHPQQIQAALASRIRATGDQLEVLQQIVYDIAYVAADELVFDIPAPLRETPIIVRLDGQELGLSRLESNQQLQLRALLPSSRIGPLEIQLSYQLLAPKQESQGSSAVTVPLVHPARVELASQELEIDSSPRLELRLTGNLWSPEAGPAPRPGGNAPAWSADAKVRSVPLLADFNPIHTDVRRCWIQSWLTAGQRRDRVAYLLDGGRRRVTVQLPQGVLRDSLEVLVDDQRVEPTLQGNKLTIGLNDRAGGTTTLLLRYDFAGRSPRNGQLDLQAPQLSEVQRLRPLYWELVLPADELLVGDPAEMTAEYDWRRQGLTWAREARWSEAQLRAWVGAPEAAERPPRGSNRYLFSQLGAASQLNLRVADRSRVVLLSSGLALVAGLLLIYVPALRRWDTLLVLGVLLAALGLLFPGPAPLIAQAAVLGVGLVALGAFLRRGYLRRRGRGVIVRSQGSWITRKPALQYDPVAVSEHQGSTATASVMLPVSLPDSKS